MRTIGLALMSLVPALYSCSGETETLYPETAVEEPEFGKSMIYIDTPELGLYVNHGRHLPAGSRYELGGVNGCNAIFLYTEGSSEAAVTHYEPYGGMSANLLKLAELSENNEGLRLGRAHATIFYVQPNSFDEEVESIKEVFFLTGSLRTVYGNDTMIRYMSYPMTKPGSDGSTPSLLIDLNNQVLDSEWHDPVSVMIDEDDSFRFPREYVPEDTYIRIREISLGFFDIDG